MSTVGVIGLGRTGLPIAANLIERGHTVVGYRRSDTSAFVKLGGRVARSPRAVAEATDIVLSCLPSVEALDSVMKDLLPAAGAAHVVVELGSFPLLAKEAWRDRLALRGAAFIDGEISGTPAMTSQRQSVFLLAGDKEACERALNICADATEHSRYAGRFGAATKLKLVANVLVAVHTVAAAEAVVLAERAGLDLKLAIDVLGLGAGSSTMFRFRAPMMAARKFSDPAPGPVSMLAAYLEPIAELAKSSGASLELFPLAAALFASAAEQGRSAEDIACVVDLVEQRSKEGRRS